MNKLFNKMTPTPFIVFVLAVFIICTSCSEEIPGLNDLKKLCEKDAGLTIYKTVEADGYYDDITQCHHCWHELINTPLDNIEFCDHKSERSPLTYILKEHGCYRLSKVARSTGQCHEEIDKDVAKRVIEPFTSFKKDQCIKVDKIDNPSLGIGLFLLKDEKMISNDDFDISRYEYTIKSNNDNQIYGKYINYSLVRKTVGGAGYGCGSSAVTGQRVSVKNPSFYKAFISKVIEVKE